MRSSIRMSLLATCLAGVASLPVRADNPTFSVTFQKIAAQGPVTLGTATGASKLAIQARPAENGGREKQVFRLLYPEDGSHLADQLYTAIRAGESVRAVVTFQDPAATSAPLPGTTVSSTVITLGGLSHLKGWNDDDDADPTAGEDSLVRLRCRFSTFQIERRTEIVPGSGASGDGSAPGAGGGTGAGSGSGTGTGATGDGSAPAAGGGALPGTGTGAGTGFGTTPGGSGDGGSAPAAGGGALPGTPVP